MMSSCKFKISPTNQRHSKVITMNVRYVTLFFNKIIQRVNKEKTLFVFFGTAFSTV